MRWRPVTGDGSPNQFYGMVVLEFGLGVFSVVGACLKGFRMRDWLGDMENDEISVLAGRPVMKGALRRRSEPERCCRRSTIGL